MQLLITIVCLLVISATMLVRAHDLGFRPGLSWHARRIGFIVSGFTPIGVILRLWQHNLVGAQFYWTLFVIGVMLVFVTTPYLPPWWRWISGFGSNTAKDGQGGDNGPSGPGERA